MARLQFSGRKKTRRSHMDSSVNITPLVDVMLVLMVIFMVSAPMLNVGGVQVNLPQTSSKPLETTHDEPLIITMSSNKELFLQDTILSFNDLVSKVKAILQQKKETKVLLKADKSLSYGQVMEMMGQLSDSGIGHISLVVATSS